MKLLTAIEDQLAPTHYTGSRAICLFILLTSDSKLSHGINNSRSGKYYGGKHPLGASNFGNYSK